MKIEKIEHYENGAAVLAWILLYNEEHEEEQIERFKQDFMERVKDYDEKGIFLEPVKILDKDAHYKITEFAKSLGKASFFLSVPDDKYGEEIIKGIHAAFDDFKNHNWVNIRDRAERELKEEGIKSKNGEDAEFQGMIDWRMQKKLTPFQEMDNSHLMESVEV